MSITYGLSARLFRFIVSLLLVVSASLPTQAQALSNPNFVVILTDDQRSDILWAMPILQEKLAARGVTFNHAIMTTPLCCPARASLLSGGFYAHNTGVLTNGSEDKNGGAPKFLDHDSLPVRLQAAGYNTAMVGKYLNGYKDLEPLYVPPGWTYFVETNNSPETMGSSTPTSSSIGTALPTSGFGASHDADLVMSFLDQYGASENPFFILVNNFEPHYPATSPPQFKNMYTDYFYRERAWLEEDMSDKPKVVSDIWTTYGPQFSSQAEEDEFHRKQLRAITAVDASIGTIVDRIEAMGKLDNTVFFFLSDNGMLWGEHGLYGKGVPYEESTHVPYVVVMPGVEPRTDDHLVAANLDTGTTIMDLAGIPRTTDGMSLVPLLTDPDSTAWRSELLIEDFVESGSLAWAGIRTEQYRYAQYLDGSVELYDLLLDPYELESKHADPAYAQILADLRTKTVAQRGLAIQNYKATAEGKTGTPFSLKMTAVGGTKLYHWSIVEGTLPAGLTLNSGTGEIAGTPTQVISSRIQVLVTDSSVSPYHGGPQTYQTSVTITIKQGSVIVSPELTGTVSDPNNAAIASAKVTVIDFTTKAVTATSTTDTSGNYTIDGIPSGTYLVTAFKSGYKVSPPKKVTITQDQLSTVNLKLR